MMTVGDLLCARDPQPELVKWTSDTTCDFCQRDCMKVSPFFVDGKTQYGPWALMCSACWPENGIARLGMGYGQKYDSVTREKIEG